MSAPKPPPGGFLHELKRRRVFRVAAVYLVVAWALVEGTDTLTPLLLLPEWLARVVAVLAILGFPVAVGLAWAFDATPDGIRREQPGSSGPASPGPARGERRMAPAYIGIGMVIAIMALGAYATLGSDDAPDLADEEIRSIAVLPFVNMSGDAQEEYFSDGITEELLNVLAQVPELRVAARTSSFAFKGQNVPVPDIGRRLNVQAVLEGSVRRDGDRLRITAQLIDVSNGYHLWSDTYDRERASIFAIQDEISAAIVDALRVRLAGGSAAAVRPTATVEIEAHDLYLLGLQHWHRRTEQDLLRALELFQSAVERDPGYARAHAGLALTYAVVVSYTDAVSVDDARRLGKEAAYRALSLDASLPEAYAALGQIAQTYDWDLAESERQNRRAIQLNPNFATAHQWLAETLDGMGRHDDAWREIQVALRLDPLSALMMNVAGTHYFLKGDAAAAEIWFMRSRDAAPGFGLPIRNLSLLYLDQGRYDEAIAAAGDRAAGLGATWAVYLDLVEALRDPSGRPRALEIIAGVPPGLTKAYFYALAGEPTRAMDELESVTPGSPNGAWLAVEPRFRPLHADPRWPVLMRRLGFSAYGAG